MSKKLVGRSTATDVYAETDTQEGLELLAQLLGLLQAGGTVGGNEVQRLQGLLVQIRRLGLDHLNSHNTQRPAVNLGTVLLLFDNLGCHPVRGTHHGGALALGLSKLGTEAKVSDFDVANTVEENIVTLNITVNDVLAMQVGQPLASLQSISVS